VGCHLGVYSREVSGRPDEKICVVDEDRCDGGMLVRV